MVTPATLNGVLASYSGKVAVGQASFVRGLAKRPPHGRRTADGVGTRWFMRGQRAQIAGGLKFASAGLAPCSPSSLQTYVASGQLPRTDQAAPVRSGASLDQARHERSAFRSASAWAPAKIGVSWPDVAAARATVDQHRPEGDRHHALRARESPMRWSARPVCRQRGVDIGNAITDTAAVCRWQRSSAGSTTPGRSPAASTTSPTR